MTTVEASYFRLRVLADAEFVHRTIEIDPDTLIDLDADGRITGVECIGRPFDIDAAVRVLRAVVWPERAA